ncbi:hypothetical protein [Gluconobacter sp. OJB]|uniref:hypothetical protein n=1 Tax=Gluconobacter sp. OJB TaxID=3145196 RepID=UPI0031F7970B
MDLKPYARKTDATERTVVIFGLQVLKQSEFFYPHKKPFTALGHTDKSSIGLMQGLFHGALIR